MQSAPRHVRKKTRDQVGKLHTAHTEAKGIRMSARRASGKATHTKIHTHTTNIHDGHAEGIAQKVDNIAIIKKNHRAGFKQKKSIIIVITLGVRHSHTKSNTQKLHSTNVLRYQIRENMIVFKYRSRSCHSNRSCHARTPTHIHIHE